MVSGTASWRSLELPEVHVAAERGVEVHLVSLRGLISIDGPREAGNLDVSTFVRHFGIRFHF